MKTHVLIVDDHPVFQMGMRELLNQSDDFMVCGLAGDIEEARQILSEQKVDLAIIDITLDNENGLDLVRQMNSRPSPIPVLVLSLHDETVWAERAIRAGARGYLMKKEPPEQVLRALARIRDGGMHVSARMMSRLLTRLHENHDCTNSSVVDSLTDRELEVFRLIGAGLSTGEIADRLTLGTKTIGTYRERIKHKLGLKTAAELTRQAVLWSNDGCLEPAKDQTNRMTQTKRLS